MRDDAVLRRALPLGRGLGRNMKQKILQKKQSQTQTHRIGQVYL